jgi:hypothetical protein
MLNNNYPRGVASPPRPARTRGRDFYAGSYTDRRRRFEFRSWRRSGDWFALGVPNILLWLDEDFLPEDVYEY